MRLHVLGAGCPQPTASRYGSAFILEIGDELIMIDCGPAATAKMAQMDLGRKRVEHLFLTHHHYDHNADVPCFALTRWESCAGSEPSLKLYGPPPTKAFVEQLFGERGAFRPDIESRVTQPVSLVVFRMHGGAPPRPRPVIDVKEIAPTAEPVEVVATAHWSVTSMQVHHVEPTLISLAYRFETKEGSIVFAADCGDCPAIRQLARDADTMVMACTHFGSPPADPLIVDCITGTPDVAAIGTEANVKRLVLTHTSPNFGNPGVIERAISEVARNYRGLIVFPDELKTVELG